ncbi:YdcF family protein [Hymenobacter sp. GOD-10R]|uniref:YdcF family protein n=1 Tax=Hymenobacter sp. GOD-10R TaxID=3093922 RepID=UPI002D778BDA|nr:YdcF family protein [Hymenobacter sp. GOD-10R]WRQ30695.1 YdcF family protein [Hymenobacter sp. GOD-10R]
MEYSPQRLFSYLLGLLLLCTHSGFGQALPASPSYARIDSIIVAKAFPLLALFEAQPALRQALQESTGLQTLARRQAQRSYGTLRKQPVLVARFVDSLVWQPQEIRAAGQQLQQLYATNTGFRAAVAPLLTRTGRYPLYASRPDTAALRLAWQDAAQGLNRILRVYLANAKPRYPVIDSSSFARRDAGLAQQVRQQLRPLTATARRRPATFYTLPLQAALAALRLNGRDEAARYEPLTAGPNAGPQAAVARTEWARYAYSVILVPGSGPSKLGVALDSMGAYRCRLAAERYRAGQAPFVVVSGGYVHPNKTPYCEAVEMKKYMVETLGLPDAAVLIDPHARHTTTNLRNTVRMLYAFGFPTDKPLLTVTDISQSRGILNMAARCQRELGYVPYGNPQRVSETENACQPVPEARQPDPFDPLDP